jgi:hypothetical protein
MSTNEKEHARIPRSRYKNHSIRATKCSRFQRDGLRTTHETGARIYAYRICTIDSTQLLKSKFFRSSDLVGSPTCAVPGTWSTFWMREEKQKPV